VLAQAEMGIESDTNLFKIGDGSNDWTHLAYGGLTGPTGSIGYINQSLIPVLSDTYDLGSPSNRFRDLYVSSGSIFIGGSKIATNEAGDIVTTGSIIPDTDILYDIGSSNYRFRDLYLSSGSIFLGTGKLTTDADGNLITYNARGDPMTTALLSTAVISTLNANAVMLGVSKLTTDIYGHILTDASILPEQETTYDLGSSNLHFRNLYLGAGKLTTDETGILVNYDSQGNPIASPMNIILSTAMISSIDSEYINVGSLETQFLATMSDQRFKHQIEPLENCLSIITKLNPVKYNWKVGPTFHGMEKEIGFLAQELEQVLPNVVRTTDHKTVSYGNLTAVLVGAIQELQQEIQRLKSL